MIDTMMKITVLIFLALVDIALAVGLVALIIYVVEEIKWEIKVWKSK